MDETPSAPVTPASVDWSAVRVGDPDPTPDSGPGCAAVTTGDGGWPLFCTRHAHTDGPHIAGAGLGGVVAVWT